MDQPTSTEEEKQEQESAQLTPIGLNRHGKFRIGAPIFLVSGIAVLFGAYSQLSVCSGIATILISFWVLSVGVYLTVKCFKQSPIMAGMDSTDTPIADRGVTGHARALCEVHSGACVRRGRPTKHLCCADGPTTLRKRLGADSRTRTGDQRVL